MSGQRETDWPSLARQSLARARLGTLALSGDSRLIAVVSVAGLADGTPLVWLEPGSHLAPALEACPVATLSMRGPSRRTRLELLGTFAPVSGAGDGRGRRGYRCTLLGVQLLGEQRVRVPVDAFRDAAPPEPRHDAAALLDHLALAHGPAILDAVHAQGLPGEVVVPRAVEGRTVEVAVLWHDGVTTVRMTTRPGCAGRCRDDD